MVVSLWGIVMLALMGVFLQFNALTFAEDLPFDEEKLANVTERAEHIDEVYQSVSMNCYYAAGAYVVTFIASAVMWRINARSNYTTA
ncbi:hypothetical protein NP493_376g03035 [Ridgeia piscesae]|uniref:Uncharacterized protein n=1 Tax=Ridgeia piscesae TaxID=27915 RepID=A0AAD9L2M9_RIDPI|nr:hypothetical protein NP493_376g03035 [Ridgeia piscesae]